MALSKTITYSNGMQASYHRITWFDFVRIPDTVDIGTDETNGIITEEAKSGYSVTILVESYVSQNIREKDAALHVNSQKYFFQILSEDLAKADVMTVLYNKLKTYPEFEGAVDC